MKTRIAVLSIIVEDSDSVALLNELLHEASDYIVGRMGIPYRARNLNIMSIVMDAPQDKINSLAGAAGKLPGVTVKTAYSSFEFDNA